MLYHYIPSIRFHSIYPFVGQVKRSDLTIF